MERGKRRKKVDGGFDQILLTHHCGGSAPCLPHFRNALAFLGHRSIHFVRAQMRSLFYKYIKPSCCTRRLFADISILYLGSLLSKPGYRAS